jgi:hypothetical protein
MKMSLDELDAEIGQIEARIAAERIALDEAVNGCTNSLKNTIASPKTLLALTGIGYAVGKMMFGRSGGKPEPDTAKKAGVLGMLTGVAGTAIGLMQPKFGVGTIAKWAASRYFGSKKDSPSPAAPVRAAPARRTTTGV